MADFYLVPQGMDYVIIYTHILYKVFVYVSPPQGFVGVSIIAIIWHMFQWLCEPELLFKGTG